jgi:hypothetical protein
MASETSQDGRAQNQRPGIAFMIVPHANYSTKSPLEAADIFTLISVRIDILERSAAILRRVSESHSNAFPALTGQPEELFPLSAVFVSRGSAGKAFLVS